MCARAVCLGAVIGFACGGAAQQIRTVTETIESGGVDLLAFGDEWRKDILAGQPAGSGQGVAVTGVVTHAAGLTAANPFVVSNGIAGSWFVLSGADLVGKTPVLVQGAADATTYFAGAALTNDVKHEMFDWSGTVAQIDELVVSSKDGTPEFRLDKSKLHVRYNTYLGLNGGSGALFVGLAGCLGRDNSDANAWVGERGQAYLRLGHATQQNQGFSHGRLTIDAGKRVDAWHVYFGSAKNDAPPDDGTTHYAGEADLLSGATLRAVGFHVAGSTDSILRFKGGAMESWGWVNYITFEQNSSANLVCEGVDGNPVNLKMTKFAQFVSWGSNSTGHLIVKGDSDVYLYGGDGQSDSSIGGSKHSDPDHRIEWKHTGDLYFKFNSDAYVAQLQSDDFLPANSWNGGVCVEPRGAGKTCRVELNGTTQNCNSLFGGGRISNCVEQASAILIGQNNNDCVFDAELLPGGRIDIVKKGTGEIRLMKPAPWTFTFEGGSAFIPADSAFTAGTLVTRADTRLTIEKPAFAFPADYDMNGENTASVVLGPGTVLLVGGDGADRTVDFSKLSGSIAGVVEKVGAGTVRLVNATGFHGILRVTEGTLEVDSNVGAFVAGGIEVADGATLSLGEGVDIETPALSVRGAAGAVKTRYSGAAGDGVMVLPGLSGAGTVYVQPSAAVWTGAADDDPFKAGNWKDLPVAPAVTAGFVTATFAENDADGVMNVPSALSLAGIRVNDGIGGSFTFRATSPQGSLGVGADGVETADRETDTAVRFETPVVFTETTSSLKAGAKTKMFFHAPLAGGGDIRQTVERTGSGEVHFHTTNSLYKGTVSLLEGTTHAYGAEPFGPPDEAGTSCVTVDGIAGAKLYFNGCVVTKDVRLLTSYAYRLASGCAQGTTNVFLGRVYGGSCDQFEVPDKASLIFAGGYGKGTEYVNWTVAGHVTVTNKPLNIYKIQPQNEGGLIEFRVPSNRVEGIHGWERVDYNYGRSRISVGLHTDEVFTASCPVRIYTRGDWDFHGTRQHIGLLFHDGTFKSFDGPALLTMAPTSVDPKLPESSGDFAGEFSLALAGHPDYVFCLTNRAVSATGTVAVASGTFRLGENASWLNATNVTVTGGVLDLTASGQLGKDTDFNLAGGALNLGAGVTQKARWVWLDGEETHAAPGLWGALDNTSVPASRRTARITGPGLLHVRGDGTGCVFILK